MRVKNEQIEYRNAVYFGQTLVTSQNHKLRNGIGLLISDSGQLVFGYWANDNIHGKYFYSSQRSSAYGYMKQGQFEGWNILKEGDLKVWCQCRAGLFHGNIIIKKGNYQPEAYLFNLGEKVKEISILNTSDPVKTLITTIQTKMQLFINNIVNDQKLKSNVGAIKLPTLTYYGSVDYKNKCGEGIGFTIVGSSLFSMGMYKDTQLHGLGRKLYDGDVEDGIFNNGKLAGIIFKWSPKRAQYSKIDYSSRQSILLSKGNQYPQTGILDMRQEFHLRSMNFTNDYVAMDELIRVDLSSIKVNRPQALKARTNELVQKLAKQYLDSTPSPKSKSAAKKQQSLSFYKNAQKALAQTKIKVSQQFQSPEQIETYHRYQQRLKVSQFSPIYKTNLKLEEDNLEQAIKQYHELQRIQTSLKR